MVTPRPTPKVLAASGVLTLSLGVLACTGIIDASKDGPAGNPGSGSGGGASGVPTDPGRKTMHRLNSAEYNATVQDVLGTSLTPATELWRGGENHGFDNIAEVLGIDELQYQRYFDAAGAVADDVFSANTAKARIVSCAATDDVACVESIISSTGLRVFRRPLSAEELTTYRSVYVKARQLGENHDGSLKQVVRALLASAEFLYRIETDPEPNSAAIHPLEPYQLASRVSYFLWSSSPDDALLEAAADSTIAKPAGLSAVVDRLLDDPKSERFVRNFVGQWLGARQIGTHAVTPELFPEWSPELAVAMAEEVYQYFSEFARGDRPWLDFLKADVNFVDGNLARLYGLSPPAQGTARIEVTNDKRAGFLGLAGFLALSSYEYRTAPTLRGRWILINLLCSPPKDPPPGIPKLDVAPGSADSSQQNVRQRLEEHRTNPVCAKCHAALDPYGLALENFDAIGKFRSTYPNGSAIDASTVLDDGSAFDGLDGLSNFVSTRPKFTQCVTEKLFIYGLGRGVETTDQPYLTLIEKEWLSKPPTLRRLIKSLVLADTFRMRRGEAAN